MIFGFQQSQQEEEGFTIEVVKNCPASRGSVGVIRMTPRVIGLLAGAVDYPIEWGALLIGTRSQGGMIVEVTDLRIPLQATTGGSVRLEEVDITPDVVGAVHLHPPSIGAFFSKTDEDDINRKFPTSIVVSRRHEGITPESQEERLLGFCYEAVGKATLPCGALGSIRMRVIPSTQEKSEGFLPLDPIVEKDTGELGDCQNFSMRQGDLYERVETACGISSPERVRYAIFGQDPQFLEQVKAARVLLLEPSGGVIDHPANSPIPRGYKQVGPAKYWTPRGWMIHIKPGKKLLRSKAKIEIDNKRQYEEITEQGDIPSAQYDDYLVDYWEGKWR